LMGANEDDDEYETSPAAPFQAVTSPTKSPSRDPISEGLSSGGSHSETKDGSNRMLIYVVAGVVGCAFFALEIVWYRMLAPILGGTTYTFGLILCVALAGIGLGGLFYHLLFRVIRPSYAALAVTLGCEAVLAIVPYALGDRLAIWAGAMSQTATGFGILVWGWVLIAGVVAFPVAFISGIQFPLLIALLGQGRREVSQHIGTAYAWNTGGSIVGSLAAGFGGLPMLGALGLWRGIAVALAATCVVVVVRNARRLPAMGIAGVLVAITLGCLFATGPTAAWRHSGIGAARTRVPADNVNQLQNWSNNRRRSLIWEADGVESSVGLVTNDGLSFFVNGKNDGNALRDAPTQIGMAILGAVLHPQPKQALVVGLGTGETAGWLAEMRGMESVEVLEIEPAVDEMARRSHRLNWDVLNHPRVRRIYNDAREHMLTVRKDYDVIVSEPSNPYRAGIATLYTQEFYRAVFQRLRDDGVFVQFVQAYEIDVETVEIVLATIRSVFPHVEIWQTGRSDMQLICYKRAVEYNVEELNRRLDCPAVREAMRRAWYVEGVEGFMAQLVAASALADEIQRRPSSILNTDDRTVLEYRFAKTVGMMTPFSLDTLRMHIAADGLHRVPFSGSPPDWDLIELHQHETSLMHRSFTPNSLVADGERRQVVRAISFYDQHDFAQVVASWPVSYLPPRNEIQRLVLAHAYAELGREECLKLLDEAMDRCPAECGALRAVYFNRAGDIPSATDELVRLFTRLADDPWMMTVFLDPALGAAIDVARVDPSAAERIAATLVHPFAEYRYEPFRVMLRIRVAQHAGPEILAAAFADLEPNPEWTAELLELRAATYRAVQHPLAVSAERDWQKFQRSVTNPVPSNE
ncbi:MAG TPA: fused MFS/spermidine synthase, partial [Pirellulaceae bacterium]|nr:fused MFS/spermidine synthase [Pirellulaceae bacterium]